MDKQTFDELSSFYKKNYKIIATYQVGSGKPIEICDTLDRCRFCGKRSPEVTFNEVAHAIPEFLGNKQLILKNECDTCNYFFGNNLEVNLDKITKPYRVISEIKGKRKAPSYKSRNKLDKIDSKNGRIKIIIPGGKGFKLNYDKKTGKLDFEIESYVPQMVYKCFVKIALSVIAEDEVNNFLNSYLWIKGESSFINLPSLKIIKSFIPGPKPNRELLVRVFKKKDLVSLNPGYFLIVQFGNVSYQAIIPSELDTLIKSVNFRPYPLFFDISWKYGYVTRELIDLSSTSLKKDEVISIPIGFGSAIHLPFMKGISFDELGVSYAK